MSGYLVSVSSTLLLALAKSTWSVRTSMICDLGAVQRLADALHALARVVGVQRADEQHDLAAVRQRLLDLLARLTAGGDVVGADIGDAVALRRVAVGGEQHRLGGDLVQLLGGVRRVVDRDRDAGDAAASRSSSSRRCSAAVACRRSRSSPCCSRGVPSAPSRCRGARWSRSPTAALVTRTRLFFCACAVPADSPTASTPAKIGANILFIWTLLNVSSLRRRRGRSVPGFEPGVSPGSPIVTAIRSCNAARVK